MSVHTQTLNQKITSSIYGTNKSIKLKVSDAQAAVSEAQHNLKALEEDARVVADIARVLNYRDEQFTEVIPNTCLTQNTQELLRSYLILLAIVLNKSPDANFSNQIRSRFYVRSLVVDPKVSDLSSTNAEALRANFINLLEIHGPFSQPSWWNRFVAKTKAYFAK